MLCEECDVDAVHRHGSQLIRRRLYTVTVSFSAKPKVYPASKRIQFGNSPEILGSPSVSLSCRAVNGEDFVAAQPVSTPFATTHFEIPVCAQPFEEKDVHIDMTKCKPEKQGAIIHPPCFSSLLLHEVSSTEIWMRGCGWDDVGAVGIHAFDIEQSSPM